jgi:hypothetical protein
MKKQRPKSDPEREERISMEIVVDAYDEEERSLGWYYYLQDRIQFPFTATCIADRSISPLHVKDEVEVNGLADESECRREIFVIMRWEKDGLAVPLMQLKPIAKTDDESKEAVADWHYWVAMGYEF